MTSGNAAETGTRPRLLAFPLVMALRWACQDLNLGPHPETKIARVPTGSAAPRAELGRACCPILIPRGGPRPWGSYQLNAGNRCADRHSCRSRPTVRAKGMRSNSVLVCVLANGLGTHRLVSCRQR